MKTRCIARLAYDLYPCSKPGKVARDGRWYCGIHDPERRPGRYRDDGGTYFCRRCQVSFVKDERSIADHERQNPYRHGGPR